MIRVIPLLSITILVCCLGIVSPARSGSVAPSSAYPTDRPMAPANKESANPVSAAPQHSELTWNMELMTSLRKGLDEGAHGASLFGVNLTRQWSQSSLGLEMAFFNQWTQFEGPHIRGFEDLRVTWRTSINPEKDALTRAEDPSLAPGFSAHASLGLPTSETSQAATQRLTLRTGGSAAWPLRYAIISHEHGAQFFSHAFDTADAAGLRHNPQVAIFNAMNLDIPLPRRFRLSFSGEFFSYWTYRQRQHDILSLRTRIGTYVSEPLVLFAEITTRDQRVSNISLFDDDNTQLAVGALYAL